MQKHSENERKQPSAIRRFLNIALSRRTRNAPQQIKQEASSPQGNSNHSAAPIQLDTFERMQEYRAVLEHQAQLSTRRQHVHDVYIGLNTIFLKE